MNGVSVSKRNEKTSVKHRTNPFEGSFAELANFDNTKITLSENDNSTLRNTNSPSSEILSTPDLISAVGYALDRARKPLSALVSKSSSTCKPELMISESNSNCKSNSSKLVQENVELLENNQNTSRYDLVPFWRTVLARSTLINDSHCLLSTKIPSNLGSSYKWMAEIAYAKQNNYIDLVSQDADLALVNDECENSTVESEDDLPEHKKEQSVTFIETKQSEVDISLLPERKMSPYTLAKHEHAFAGAMAGVFVSLCLHPVDTVKTVIQSCRADQKPLHDVGRSIIAERGITGLYRGISSNIVTSAPISAVYTFTYESVKKSLLPLLPKEHHSLAHCTAGGCASVATSFIFTPSERIKQQMQIGSHYRNCWNAFIQVVQKGGVLSLYNGWGAVLCRNVPHSVIKFYTYESLKQIMLPSNKSNAEANLVTTLVCGGLAGSMASLFTTPLDVVKTRLQTQIPGSIASYSGVFNTLTDIGKQEGLKGLYRGLTPRLVMYMIQGALFFASYESFKGLFSLDVPQQLVSAQTLQHDLKKDEDSMMLPTAVSVSA
ncbi:hypothetical protein CASFOL_020106 [Castilleja foliolosa]|uniref:Mitochondrial carrier protein n=1 Tax=Castilleja foliolosa TaxID=1961234 RepID=A0ABD3D2P9_9LAMI